MSVTCHETGQRSGRPPTKERSKGNLYNRAPSKSDTGVYGNWYFDIIMIFWSQICVFILLVCPMFSIKNPIVMSELLSPERLVRRTGGSTEQAARLSTESLSLFTCQRFLWIEINGVVKHCSCIILICGFCCVPTSTACNLFLRPGALANRGVWCVPLEVSWVVGPVVFSGTGGGSSRGGGSHLGPRSRRTTMKSGFHSVELNKTVWEVPERWAVIRKMLEIHLAWQTSYRRRTNKYVRNKGRFDDISLYGFFPSRVT